MFNKITNKPPMDSPVPAKSRDGQLGHCGTVRVPA